MQRPLPRALAEVFRAWQPASAAGSSPEVEAVFSAGHSNRNFLVRFGAERFVVRLPENGSKPFAIDRHVEQRVLQCAERIGLGVPVLYCDPLRGTLVTAYLESKPLRIEGLGADDVIDRLASALRTLHAQEIDIPSLNIADRVRLYARELQSNDPRAWPRARRWLAATRQVLEQYRFGRWRTVLCHNDLLSQNILDVEGKLYFIDWEYAACGDPFFDLATLVEDHGFGALDRERLLLAYGEIADLAAERLYRARVLYRLLSIMWYLIRYRGAAPQSLPALQRHEQALEALLRLGPES